MLDGASQQNDTNDNSIRNSLSVLHQKIRRHIKEAAAIQTDASTPLQLSCCLFLENLKDVNKEVACIVACTTELFVNNLLMRLQMLTLAKINRIGFLEPSGLASGVFSNTTPTVTSMGNVI